MGLKVIETQNFNTFKEFWDAISPFSEFGRKMKGFIYRGESSINWKLLPKILRCDDKDEPERIKREINDIIEFVIEANYQGLKVPNNKMVYYSLDEIMENDIFWISDEFEETVALAQHYGLPTRLIDWTKDIFVAFYFASTGVMEKQRKNDDIEPYLVIYALNYGFLKEEIKKWSHTLTNCIRKPFPIKFLIPHYSDNPNIMAQTGILSYSEVNIKIYSSNTWKTDYTPLDEKLQELVDDKDHDYHISKPETLLYKFIVSPTEASVMFDFISHFNYSYSRIFPGYNGIIKTLEEKKLLMM